MPGKQRETGATVARAADALWRAARVPPLLSSFAEEALEAAGAAVPRLPRALLVDAIPHDWQARLERLQCEGLNADWRALDAELVAAGHSSGYRMLTYTANDPQQVAQLAAWGLDTIITDAIDVVPPL